MKIRQVTSLLMAATFWLSIYALPSAAEDGYELWLRYPALTTNYLKKVNQELDHILVVDGENAQVNAAVDELNLGLKAMTGKQPKAINTLKKGTLVLATTPQLAQLNIQLDQSEIAALGNEGYLIRQLKVNRKNITLITATKEIGLVYGSFALLQHLQVEAPLTNLNLSSSPKVQLRVLNHWDNLDRTVERGYAGQSIWDWWNLPDILDPRYKDYARANAAVGINGTVLNNVNAKADSLSARYIAKAAALADVFRPYGIKVYLSARFSAPIDLGGLPSSDPLQKEVQQWWQNKTDEIYRAIPDFGGFLVKANSEGQPGPQDYGRSHADGANMLAQALQPHGGVVMWRAFVYSEHDPDDRAKQAYSEFQPLDGTFLPNVLVQVKNGPIDFQPREPFHPMFGAMPKTPLMLELQITKEYLGFASHLAYLAPLYQEVLQADTYRQGPGSTVAKVIDGQLHQQNLTGMAGVANIGRDRNWSGSIFDQANWFAYARLAWNPYADARDIAKQWLAITFTPKAEFIEPAADMMMASREAVVNYMTPLGLTHLMDTGHHYGPGPWVSDLARPEWNPAYYHRANKKGIGFDRTPSGSNALKQYAPEVAQHFSDLTQIEDEFLLWFHHLPWSYKMKSGKNLWSELVLHYDKGVNEVKRMQQQWQTLKPYVDAQRFDDTQARLKVQLREAQWWRDASIAYFKEVSGLELPEGVQEPEHSLEYYQSLSFPYAPGN